MSCRECPMCGGSGRIATKKVFACHVDGEPSPVPNCVLDAGRRDDCFEAINEGYEARWQCPHWRQHEVDV